MSGAGPLRLEVVEPQAIASRLGEALDGAACLAPASDAATIAMLQPERPVVEPDAALIVATSGSTGRPRGVVLTRAGLRAGAEATHARLGGPGTWHCALPTSYVAGVMTLVRAHVAQRPAVLARPDLADLGIVQGRNYLSLVPTQLHRALASDDLTRRLAAFDAVLVGGAALDPALAARAAASGVRVVTTYGASETGGGCVYDGVPLDGVEVTLRGERVVIGGPTIFAGYRLDPAATASALVDGRFVTHDRGRWSDGRLDILGRLDEVVISGGVNVDLAQAQRVADAVMGTPEAGGIVLIGVPDAEWGTKVVAIAARAAESSDADATARVRDALRAHLAPAALPHEVRLLDSLPRTSSGKIDRQSLIRSWR